MRFILALTGCGIFLWSSLLAAGPLEAASELAYKLENHQKCGSLDLKAVQQSLNSCPETLSSAEQNQRQLQIAAQSGLDSAESDIFQRLAKATIPELHCAADFSQSVAQGGAPLKAVQDQFENFKAISQQYQTWLSQSEKSYHDCPGTQTELDQVLQLGPALSFPPETQGAYRKFCQKGLSLQKAWQLSRSTLPLGNMPSVAKLIRPKLGAGLKLEVTDSQIQKAYQQAAADLNQEANHFQQKNSTGGLFSTADRRALFSDPQITRQVFSEISRSKDMDNFYCHLNARYGQGSQDLAKDLFLGQAGIAVASLGSGLVVDGLVSGGWVTASSFEAAAAARTGGLISSRFVGTLALDTILVGSNLAVNLTSVEESCKAYKVSVQSQKALNCSSAPSVLQVRQDSCGLAVLLAGLDVPTPLFSLVRNTTGNANAIQKAGAEIRAAESAAADPLAAFRNYRISGGKAFLGPAIGPVRVNAVDEFNAKNGTHFVVVGHDNAWSIRDPVTKELVFEMHASIKTDYHTQELYFTKIVAAVGIDEKGTNRAGHAYKFKDEFKGQGFNSQLFSKMVNSFPKVRMIRSELMYDNAARIDELVQKEGYSVAEAIKGTPSYRVYAQNGFTEIDESSVRYQLDQQGHIRVVNYVIRKP
jgi:hypothetical protein